MFLQLCDVGILKTTYSEALLANCVLVFPMMRLILQPERPKAAKDEVIARVQPCGQQITTLRSEYGFQTVIINEETFHLHLVQVRQSE